MSDLNPLGRFSSRVEDYVRYRPSYPLEVVTLLERECGLTPDSTVADVGSGTGLFTKLMLDRGCSVIGVEPNADMRRAGEFFLARYPKFSSVDGSAERTGLPDSSVDLVTAGQAFHWFDATAARQEFHRILRTLRWVALMWNERVVPPDGFLKGYEDLLNRFAPDYRKVDHRQIDDRRLTEFFGHSDWLSASFDNGQEFDLEGIRGRLESSSYAPRLGEAAYEPMIAELERLFSVHNVAGHVPFIYQTNLYYGCL